MNKKNLLLIFILSLFLCNINFVYCEEKPKEVITPIELGKIPSDSIPRSISIIPIDCYYYVENLYFTFTEDMGVVEITVVNQTTGATQTTMFDSVGGQAVMTIGNASGSYLIYIVTEDGTTYWGTFQL